MIQKLNEIFIQLDIHHFIGALRTFYCISRILRLTRINLFDQVNDVFDLSTVGVTEDSSSNEIAMAVVDEYTSLVKKCYNKGHVAFMNTSYTTADEEDGHGKTLYIHVLRYHIPKTMLDTFQKHGVGPGFFTMEGFEYVNYVSKMVH